MTLAAVQNLRSFTQDEHPTDLEPGQIAFNLAQGNINLSEGDANIYMYVGNQSDIRMDEDGTVLVGGGTAGKGWIRYSLRGTRVTGDSIYGDLDIIGASVKIRKSGPDYAELVIPKVADTPSSSSEVGSIRWNSNFGKLQAWDGAKWDNTSKVFVDTVAPANPSNGDLWLSPSPIATLYVYVVPTSGPAAWVVTSSAASVTALQPGNGVTANASNEIDIIDQGPF
jgi:hypothetical protein